jgi:hypothetical protein
LVSSGTSSSTFRTGGNPFRLFAIIVFELMDKPPLTFWWEGVAIGIRPEERPMGAPTGI